MRRIIAAVWLWIIKIICGGNVIMMAMFFAQRVILGKTGFGNVPQALKKGCAEALFDSGLADMVPTEFGGTMEAGEG